MLTPGKVYENKFPKTLYFSYNFENQRKKIVNLEILQCFIEEKMLEDYTTIKSLG